MSDSDEIDAAEPKAPKKAEKSVEDSAVLTAFTYPTIGEGVTIYAHDQQEAAALAAQHPLNPLNKPA